MIVLLLIVSTLCALVWHRFLKEFWLSVLGSTVTTVFLTWFLTASHIGVTFLNFNMKSWSKDFILSIFIISIVSLIISALVGAGFKKWSMKKGDGENK